METWFLFAYVKGLSQELAFSSASILCKAFILEEIAYNVLNSWAIVVLALKSGRYRFHFHYLISHCAKNTWQVSW